MRPCCAAACQRSAQSHYPVLLLQSAQPCVTWHSSCAAGRRSCSAPATLSPTGHRLEVCSLCAQEWPALQACLPERPHQQQQLVQLAAVFAQTLQKQAALGCSGPAGECAMPPVATQLKAEASLRGSLQHQSCPSGVHWCMLMRQISTYVPDAAAAPRLFLRLYTGWKPAASALGPGKACASAAAGSGAASTAVSGTTCCCCCCCCCWAGAGSAGGSATAWCGERCFLRCFCRCLLALAASRACCVLLSSCRSAAAACSACCSACRVSASTREVSSRRSSWCMKRLRVLCQHSDCQS